MRMDAEGLETLREALRVKQRKEELERAVGRAARNRGHDFRYYIDLVSELRDLASKKGISLDRAAESLLEEEQSGDDEGRDDHNSRH